MTLRFHSSYLRFSCSPVVRSWGKMLLEIHNKLYPLARGFLSSAKAASRHVRLYPVGADDTLRTNAAFCSARCVQVIGCNSVLSCLVNRLLASVAFFERALRLVVSCNKRRRQESRQTRSNNWELKPPLTPLSTYRP